MSKHKRKYFFVAAVLFFLFAAITGAVILYRFLPCIIQDSLAPRLAKAFGVEHLVLKVDRADISGLEISPLQISDGKTEGVEVGQIIVDASSAKIDAIDINGLNITLVADENGMMNIPGIKRSPSDGSSGNSVGVFTIPPFIAHNFSIAIHKSSLQIKTGSDAASQVINIPFKITLQRKGDDVHFSAEAEGFIYHRNDLTVSIPEFRVEGSLVLNGDTLAVTGSAEFANAEVKTGEIHLLNIAASLPFGFILTSKGIDFSRGASLQKKRGSVKIDKILFNKKNFGTLSCSYIQTPESFHLTGSHSALIKGQRADIDISLTPPDINGPLALTLAVHFSGKNLDVNLGQFHPKMADIEFKGDLFIDAGMSLSNSSREADSTIKIVNGSIENKADNFSANDINLTLNLPNLFTLRSEPSQILSFGKLNLGDIEIDDGKIIFQTESATALLFEKSEFTWCEGDVAINAFRIVTTRPENIDFTLYCDRINTAELLNQFKLGHSSGESTVTGKIPLIYKDRQLEINNGFLYSIPGVEGEISLTDFLGPAEAVNNTIQMQIATEALRDFRYNWLRVNLNSEKEDLLLRLEMDGKPAGKLPFAYDMKRGGLYKVSESDRNAEFKGISFQINFRLPANQMLHYGRGVQGFKDQL